MTDKNDLALQRTYMAATRTYFVLLRTGIAIAGGGALVNRWLAELGRWRVIGCIHFGRLYDHDRRFKKYLLIAKTSAVDEQFSIISPKLLIVLTTVLQVATLAVLALFLLSD
ncbi:MAG: hypothetical protein GY796_20695 [Chloroflexi bacterium]|nr:hypothetical protein [Chloroflexota bacterium]